ncbi:MAG: ABC transporter substrate-binding protein [Cyanobacteria bacterium P01_F01_bin.53]
MFFSDLPSLNAFFLDRGLHRGGLIQGRRRAKWTSTLVLTGALGAGLVSCGGATPTVGGADEAPFVAVTQIVEHPSLDAVHDGLKDSLADAGYMEGDALRWESQSAQGNPATAAQIATKYAGANPDVIVAIATPSAQAAVNAAQDIPVIFSAVTDPVGAKLVGDAEKPGGNVTGVSDLSPIDQHMALIREILPEAKTLGVIYSAGEDNSVSLVELVKSEAPKQDFTEIKEVTVNASSEVAGAARSLVGAVDAIYVPTDNTVVSALESVIQVGQDNDVPVFAGDTDSVERGAIAGISFDYYDVGQQTGEMVVKVLKGARPGDLPVEFVDVVQLFVNPAAAEEMGVSLPDAVTERADEVVE